MKCRLEYVDYVPEIMIRHKRVVCAAAGDQKAGELVCSKGGQVSQQSSGQAVKRSSGQAARGRAGQKGGMELSSTHRHQHLPVGIRHGSQLGNGKRMLEHQGCGHY